MAERRRRPGGEQPMVPRATFDSYYGRPILKAPTWKVPDVPAYLTAGGMAGASAVLAEVAAATDRPALARAARVASSAGALVGAGALIHDLGRPARFLNMLRVIKPTSPLSIGSWILAPFSGLSSASALSELTGVARPLGRLAGLGAAALGPAMSTYTAVLLADTAVPAWHEAHRDLPFVFAASSAGAAAGVALMAAPVPENAPAARLGALGGVAELALSQRMESRLGFVGAVYRDGRAGAWLRAARGLTAVGALGALVGRRNRAVAVLAGAALVAGSVATRWGVFEAGRASAADPKYIVVPQRERLNGQADTVDGYGPVQEVWDAVGGGREERP